MQFHLNGFRPGDPEIFEPAEHDDGAQSSSHLPAEVDVLIIGCGPAGLTLAAQLAAFPDIATRIVEQKAGPLHLGQADGIACRTMEMFHAFGFSERLLKEAHWINETTFWKPDDTQRNNIARSGRLQDVEDGLSKFPHVVLNQARVHDFYLQVMRNAPNRLEPDYARRLIDLRIDPASPSDTGMPTHPVTVTLDRIDPEHAGQVEIVKARYMVGCDGLAKGLEFRAVAVMACDDEIIPLQERIETVKRQGET
jgi:phenol 2-monooxygenase